MILIEFELNLELPFNDIHVQVYIIQCQKIPNNGKKVDFISNCFKNTNISIAPFYTITITIQPIQENRTLALNIWYLVRQNLYKQCHDFEFAELSD